MVLVQGAQHILGPFGEDSDLRRWGLKLGVLPFHLWQSKDSQSQNLQNIKQVWFPGVHCDVGGGYPEEESGLSKYALDWRLEEAKQAGLLVDPIKEAQVLGRSESGDFVATSAAAKMHESLAGLWNIAEFIPKKHWRASTGTWEHRMNLYRRRTIPPGSLVHDSVDRRGAQYLTRIPADATRVMTRPVREPMPQSPVDRR
jgi:uncharacterized protein (DUF2235 family)